MNLDIYLGGELVAQTSPRSRGTKFVIEYTDAVRSTREPGTPVLSCSLPAPGPSAPAAAWAFLEGLLPEGAALNAMAAGVRNVRLQDGATAQPSDAVNLLAEYGRECAGAVAVVPRGEPAPGPGRYQGIDVDNIARALADLPRRPLGADPDSDIRMSLAGNQPKLLLARQHDQWYQPVHGAPSTHILKPTGVWTLSADNECAVMTIARAVGLTDSQVWVETFGDIRVCVAQRYDRKSGPGGEVVRLHQEDMCQALGMRPREKYLTGRPSGRMAALLREVPTVDPREAIRSLLRQVAFRAIVGDEDGHGKNVGLLLDGSMVRLAPMYDALTTQLYPDLSGKLGAPVGSQENLAKVDLGGLVEEGVACGIDENSARRLIVTLADEIAEAARNLPAEGLDEQAVHAVRDTVLLRIQRLRRCEQMGTPPAGAVLSARTARSSGTLDRATLARTSPSGVTSDRRRGR